MGKTIILYASLTGNTQMAAMQLAVEVAIDDCLSVEEVTQAQIDSAQLVVIGTSTWGEGDYNPACEDFVARVNNSELNFSSKKVGFFGLGDSTYQIFCNAVDRLKAELVKNGAVAAGEVHKIDGFLDDDKQAELKKWTESLSP